MIFFSLNCTFATTAVYQEAPSRPLHYVSKPTELNFDIVNDAAEFPHSNQDLWDSIETADKMVHISCPFPFKSNLKLRYPATKMSACCAQLSPIPIISIIRRSAERSTRPKPNGAKRCFRRECAEISASPGLEPNA